MFLLCCKKPISFGRHDEYIALVPVFVCMGVHVLCFFLYSRLVVATRSQCIMFHCPAIVVML